MLTELFFKDKRVTVFGLGLNGGGVSSVKFLAHHKAREIIVTDLKTAEELAPSIALLQGIENITYVLGSHRFEDFSDTDMVIVNPGIRWDNEYVQTALRKGVPVEMDASLFFQLCPCPIIGVTGTKGKTTTSTLLSEILATDGRHVVRVGIGQTPVLDTLQSVTAASVVVFELSSWRLSSLRRIGKSPHIAVFTNFFPDHLNYYESMESYFEDKKNIFAFQKENDTVVFDQSDDPVAASVKDTPSRKMRFSKNGPSGVGEEVFLSEGSVIHAIDGKQTVVMRFDEVGMRGRHNAGNVLAATAGALAYGVNMDVIRKTITEFPGVEHRLEFVCEKNGVKYYNDTAATVPQAAISALRSFDEPIVLIAGGNDKGLNFSDFGEAIARHAKCAIFFKGAATEKIVDSLRRHLASLGKNVPFDRVESMGDAVRIASERAVEGDVIVLSPGATSFGLFKNEFDRGEQFRAQVHAL